MTDQNTENLKAENLKLAEKNFKAAAYQIEAALKGHRLARMVLLTEGDGGREVRRCRKCGAPAAMAREVGSDNLCANCRAKENAA